jgi:FSR family fosmidomycin resistance protein-like MFS transporter
VGGNAGHALGPLFITAVILTFGLRSAYIGMVPGLIVASLLLWAIPATAQRSAGSFSGTAPPAAHAAPAQAHPATPWGPLAFLILVVSLRSWAQIALASLIPLFYRDYLGETPLVAGTVLLVHLLAGAAGTLVGGPVADRYGPRRTLALSLLLSTPLLFAFPHLRGPLALAVVALAGFVLVSTFSLTVVIAQGLLPTRGGMAAGFMVGFAVGAGGPGVIILGIVADAWGLLGAMHVLAALPLITLPFAWALPADAPAPGAALREAKTAAR